MKAFQRFITRTLFKIYDILHQGRLTEYYNDVKAQNSSLNGFDLDKLKKYLEKWDLGHDIHELPIMTKEDVRRCTSQLSESEISTFVYTGGSTGEPLRVPFSKKRKLMRTARIAYFNERAGFDIGDRYLFIRAKEKSKIMQFLRNEVLFVPTDTSLKKIQQVSRKIVDQKISVLIGYPTVIYDIAMSIENNSELHRNHTAKSIITVSEAIDDPKRKLIKDVFNCSVIDRYSNEEVGVIAQQLEFGGEYIVDMFNVYVEVLHPDTLEPVGENEVGKVVVTDICNDLIPLVRYDTGDYAMVSRYRNGQLLSIKKVVGRTSEQITTTEGSIISPLSLGPYIHKPLTQAGLRCQFQFAQVAPKKYQLRIKGEASPEMTRTCKKISIDLKNVLGRDAEIESIFLSDIKPLSSGKRPLYRNEIGD